MKLLFKLKAEYRAGLSTDRNEFDFVAGLSLSVRDVCLSPSQGLGPVLGFGFWGGFTARVSGRNVHIAKQKCKLSPA